MASMYGGGGGKAARATKKIAKAADKAVKRMDSGKAAGKVLKRMDKVGASASDFVSAAVKSTASGSKPMVRDLSSLDKFDKRIKVRKVAKEDKASAKAYNQRLKAKNKK